MNLCDLLRVAWFETQHPSFQEQHVAGGLCRLPHGFREPIAFSGARRLVIAGYRHLPLLTALQRPEGCRAQLHIVGASVASCLHQRIVRVCFRDRLLPVSRQIEIVDGHGLAAQPICPEELLQQCHGRGLSAALWRGKAEANGPRSFAPYVSCHPDLLDLMAHPVVQRQIEMVDAPGNLGILAGKRRRGLQESCQDLGILQPLGREGGRGALQQELPVKRSFTNEILDFVELRPRWRRGFFGRTDPGPGSCSAISSMRAPKTDFAVTRVASLP
mmetsp:Transcript_56741/g.132653  ORF Transcript_56741/g.132653 Transcript_56741/m.132653 type:complete len:273 (-) Transcript_56741:124-942(-)